MKTILVFYVGIKDISPAEVDHRINHVRKLTSELVVDETFLSFVIPVRSTEDTWIECLNPVLLNNKEYQDTKDKLQFIQEQYQKSLESVKDTESNY
jgi:hypothetical protein